MLSLIDQILIIMFAMSMFAFGGLVIYAHVIDTIWKKEENSNRIATK